MAVETSGRNPTTSPAFLVRRRDTLDRTTIDIQCVHKPERLSLNETRIVSLSLGQTNQFQEESNRVDSLVPRVKRSESRVLSNIFLTRLVHYFAIRQFRRTATPGEFNAFRVTIESNVSNRQRTEICRIDWQFQFRCSTQLVQNNCRFLGVSPSIVTSTERESRLSDRHSSSENQTNLSYRLGRAQVAR